MSSPPPVENPPGATFQVYALRDTVGGAERLVWCVGGSGRELGRFPSAEAALRAAMAYARDALQKGGASAAIVSTARPDGTTTSIHLARFD